MLEKIPSINDMSLNYTFESFCDAFLRHNFSRQVVEDIKEERQEKIKWEKVNAIVTIVLAIFMWVTNSWVVRLGLKPLAYAYGGIALGFVFEFY